MYKYQSIQNIEILPLSSSCKKDGIQVPPKFSLNTCLAFYHSDSAESGGAGVRWLCTAPACMRHRSRDRSSSD